MGVLSGVTVIEFSGIGPGPFACMLLADMGATVIRIDRHSSAEANASDTLLRGKRSIAINLKDPDGVALAMKFLADADILVEGFRPGVMEKMGLAPEEVFKTNSGIIYGRMTGWGQQGPWSHRSGHDINYIAMTGALDAIGNKGSKPTIPLNLLGDFAGGSMYLVMGLLAALVEKNTSGKGQIVDASIVDGVNSMMSMFHGYRAMGMWQKNRGENLLDGGAHFYDVYQCKDGKWLSLGAIEPQFYQQLVDGLGLTDQVEEINYVNQFDENIWESLRPVFAERIKTKTQAQWMDVFSDSDGCVAPVLTIDEAFQHEVNVNRDAFITINGVTQGAPAPRFSRTSNSVPKAPVAAGSDRDELCQQLGMSTQDIKVLCEKGVLI